MKVLLVNGSPRQKGCTNTALEEIAKSLEKNGIETEIFWIGAKAVQGCTACYKCKRDACVFNDDVVAQFAKKAKDAQGFIFGSPVYYASINGSLSAFMDRLFYGYGSIFKGKPAAGIVSARRAGTTAAFDNLNKYFTINQMPIVSANYWNAVHGNTPEEVKEDKEGLQTMRVLGNNMAWLLKCIEKAAIAFPESEKRIYTNFIR